MAPPGNAWLKVVLMILMQLMAARARADLTAMRGMDGRFAVAATPFITAVDTQFGGLIEAAAVDKYGSIYATDLGGFTSTLGQVASANFVDQEVYYNDSSSAAFFNGLRFLPLPAPTSITCASREIHDYVHEITSKALAADLRGHRVLLLTKNEAGVETSSVFCQNSSMVQPNDIAVAMKAGRVYTSGQNYSDNTVLGDGDLWMCEAPGFQITTGPVKATRLGVFGRTNGIEVSPDEKTLYISEAFNKDGMVRSNKVWKFAIDPSTGFVWLKTLFVDFQRLDGSGSVDVDGMRTDVHGNLFITRNGGGEVLKFSPEGELLLRIKLQGIRYPTNLELGGPDGTSLFVVGECVEGGPGKGCVEVWHGNSAPGRAFRDVNVVAS